MLLLFSVRNDHPFGKELFIRFTVRVLRLGCGRIHSRKLPFYLLFIALRLSSVERKNLHVLYSTKLLRITF